jgi:phosphoribosyl-dephospho-CoA transferase
MVPLRRHQLACLSESGWATVLARPWDPVARDCLDHWATRRLPLVVTRQPVDAAAGAWIALGLCCPKRWDRRRLALQVPRTAVLFFDEFPRLADVRWMLPPSARAAVRELLAGLDEQHATARVFGSYGWQAISGLDHVRPDSDLDLAIGVEGPTHADAAARVLQSFGAARLRLDGEFIFLDGAAVAWREWIVWRAGRARALLVKRLEGASLQRDAAPCDHAQGLRLGLGLGLGLAAG